MVVLILLKSVDFFLSIYTFCVEEKSIDLQIAEKESKYFKHIMVYRKCQYKLFENILSIGYFFRITLKNKINFSKND